MILEILLKNNPMANGNCMEVGMKQSDSTLCRY